MMGLTKTSGSLALGLTAAVLATVVVTAAVPQKPPKPPKPEKVDVCHWSEKEGTWNKLSIGASALPAHLSKHDDAVPGGVTSTTATQLDDDCVPVPLLTCPCWNTYTQASLVAALNAETVNQPICAINNPGATVAGSDIAPIPLAVAENGTTYDCQLRLTGSDTGLQVITEDQANACNAELSSVIPLINWCPAPPK